MVVFLSLGEKSRVFYKPVLITGSGRVFRDVLRLQKTLVYLLTHLVTIAACRAIYGHLLYGLMLG